MLDLQATPDYAAKQVSLIDQRQLASLDEGHEVSAHLQPDHGGICSGRVRQQHLEQQRPYGFFFRFQVDDSIKLQETSPRKVKAMIKNAWLTTSTGTFKRCKTKKDEALRLTSSGRKCRLAKEESRASRLVIFATSVASSAGATRAHPVAAG